MLEWLKSAWASWRVRVTMVGGVVVVATAFGTCSFDPEEVSETTVVPVENNAVETTPVSETVETENTTTTTNVESGGETTETTATE